MREFVFIGLGSALGGMARHAVGLAIAARWGTAFPYGTLLVNVTGAMLIGIASFFALSPGRGELSPTAASFCIVGVLGGYTTFSAFSLQAMQLFQAARWGAAAVYIAASVGLCLAGVSLGQAIAKALR
jgi:fluoride exporter